VADLILERIQERRSVDAGYRPPTTGPRALRQGEPFVNLTDLKRCIGKGDGTFIEYSLYQDAQQQAAQSGAVNVMDGFVSEVQLAAGENVAPKVAEAAAFARANGRRALFFPAHARTFLLNGPTIDISGLRVYGLSSGSALGSRLKTEAAVSTFATVSAHATVENLGMEHYGSAGLMIDLIQTEGDLVRNCNLVSLNNTNQGALIRIGGSNSYVDDCTISNFSPGQYSILFTRTASRILINSAVRRTYFGGPGAGISIGAAPGQARPEGITISQCNSVLTGGPLVELSSCLNFRMTDNMVDQGPASGAILLGPAGQGIMGVSIVGNYISNASGGNNGGGIVHVGSGAASLTGMVVMGNEFGYCNTGASFGQNASLISFVGNYFHDMLTGISVALFDNAQAKFGESNLLGPGVVGLTTIGS